MTTVKYKISEGSVPSLSGAQPWYFEEDWRLEHLPTGKEGYKMAMKATFNTILLGLPAAEGATLIEKISLIGSKTVTKNGAGKMIDKIN